MHHSNLHHCDNYLRYAKSNHWLFLVLFGFILIELAACTVLPTEEGVVGTVPEPVKDLIRVFFTYPQYPDSEANHQNGIDQSLAASVENASESVDIAAYEINLESLVSALIKAHQRGVSVRIVTDTDNEQEIPVGQMKQAGIMIVSDHSEALMHNKFVVIDGQEVWTGSWNYTDNCTFRNNNNALAISSEKLAENYTLEFNEMFEQGKFGADSPGNTPHPWVKVGDVQVENYFSPEDDVQSVILREIRSAKNSVRFMMYVLTDDEIGKALAEKNKEGVKVQGVVEDRFAESNGSEVPFLLQENVDVRGDGNRYMMHHKVIIIDEKTVITGSYNFTRNAQKQNDENVLVIHSKEIAARYLEEYKRVSEQAKN